MTTTHETPSTPRRDRWRTVRTITCELRALTGPSTPARFGRPLAGPEMVVELPPFAGHMLLHTTVVPVRRTQRLAAVPPPAPPQGQAAEAPRHGWLGALVFFAVTGLALATFVALASS